MSIPGIDVSVHQGDIAWGAVAGAGYQFAVIKASEGVGYTDPKFAANWSGARTVGMCRGAYHFMRADLGNDPTEEADWFLSVVGALETGDFLALDIEDFPGRPQPADLYWWVTTWVGHVYFVAGFRPFLYSTRGYLQAHNLTSKPDLSDCGLWLADWRTHGGFPAPPPDWQITALWQHSDSGVVPGVPGYCDLDLFNGSLDQLRLYGKPGAATAPPRDALDALWQAEEAAAAVYTSPGDVADLEEVRQRIVSIKNRYGYVP